MAGCFEQEEKKESDLNGFADDFWDNVILIYRAKIIKFLPVVYFNINHRNEEPVLFSSTDPALQETVY